MKQVKIVLLEEISVEHDDYGYSKQLIRDSITDWEEVTDEDCELLRTNLQRIAGNKWYHSFKPMLLIKDDEPIFFRIDSIVNAIEQHKKAIAIEEAKRNEAKRIRDEKKSAKTRTQKLELLEKLKKELEPIEKIRRGPHSIK